MKEIYLIVGLGNPDKKYENTRHNTGYMAVDFFAKKHNVDININDFFSYYVKFDFLDKTIILQKPLTYMNNSGIAVSQIKNFFKINIDNILIIHDDLDLNVGEVRIKPKGSSGGHNGLKSIFQYLGTENIKRIKIGIGKSEFDTIDYVLGKFTKEEKVKIDEAISLTSDAIDDYLKHNFDLCMSHFNKKLTK